MCEFQSLYFGDDGYVVRCKKCGHYQVAFASTMLNLTGIDFTALCNIVKNKYAEEVFQHNENTKCCVIPTPSNGMYMLFTRKEAQRLHEILEEADNEEQALAMMSLFHQ